MNITLAQPNLLRNQSYINGQWVPADSGKTFAVTNPANGETIADLADCGADETTRAIEAADVALTTWRRKTAKERSLILRKWHQLILDNQEDLGKIMTLEQGKPLAEAKGEILYGASFIDWFADEARRIYGDVIPTFALLLNRQKEYVGVDLQQSHQAGFVLQLHALGPKGVSFHYHSDR